MPFALEKEKNICYTVGGQKAYPHCGGTMITCHVLLVLAHLLTHRELGTNRQGG
jgi:hypothetical protein